MNSACCPKAKSPPKAEYFPQGLRAQARVTCFQLKLKQGSHQFCVERLYVSIEAETTYSLNIKESHVITL